MHLDETPISFAEPPNLFAKVLVLYSAFLLQFKKYNSRSEAFATNKLLWYNPIVIDNCTNTSGLPLL